MMVEGVGLMVKGVGLMVEASLKASRGMGGVAQRRPLPLTTVKTLQVDRVTSRKPVR